MSADRFALGVLGVLAASCLAACQSGGASDLRPDGVPDTYELAYAQDFADKAALEGFAFSDAAVWQWSDEGARPSLRLVGDSGYKPPHRSPRCVALVKGVLLRDFVLEADLLQTGREYGHRDLCLFFGFQSPAHFYYVHMATKPDPNAHNVFLVNDAARAPVAPVAEEGIDWGDAWHRIRLVREGPSVRVYFDDMETPVIEASDDTLGYGRIGFGSFDDEGRFANVRVWAPDAIDVREDTDPFHAGRMTDIGSNAAIHADD